MTNTVQVSRPLTKSEFQFLQALKKLLERGYGPSLIECAELAGISRDTAHRCRTSLKELGKITFDPKRQRSMVVLEG